MVISMIKSRTTFAVIIFLIFTGFCSLSAYFFFLDISSFIREPLDLSANGKTFIIKPGQNLKKIAANLEEQAIISNQTYFILFTKFKKADKKLKAGEYILSAAKSPEQILEILKKGKIKLYRITVPEGLNIKEIAFIVEKAHFCSKSDFQNLCKNKTFIKSLGLQAASLEGYLFPDTYFFSKQASCKKIITTMVDHFKKIFTIEWKLTAKKMNFSIHEIVTLASIIEKETGDATERPLISSVFHNRLKKKMRLESDPTVIYGIKDFDGNITRKHLRTLTPYNTYKIKRLPPGPIANPGALSLHAALNPENTSYLFFVSKKDTTHKFSKTIKEHNQAVKKYLLR
jgi:UPF0755 protein